MTTPQILVVEDDNALAELVRDYLEAEGFAVELQTDGRQALEAALTGRHDLVLLDLMLPSLGGFEVLRAYRAQWAYPVLVVSARRDDVDKIRGLGLGADDYIAKPFSPAELVARVKAHLSRYRRLVGSSPRAAALLQAGALSYDPEKKQVSLAGVPLTLTAKEQELLVLLIEHPERLFSKEELYSRVWGDTAGDVSTVTVHIRRLREKVESDPAQPRLIETVWGLGYRLRLVE